MDLEVITPEEYIGDVIADLNAKRGKIVAVEAENDVQKLRGHVPLTEMFGYSTSLRSADPGQGKFYDAVSAI